MLKILLCVAMCSAIFGASESRDLPNHIQGTTTTEAATITEKLPAGYYKSNNLPQVDKDCKIRFQCKKKLKAAETPKPCIKFCVNFIECTDGRRIYVPANQCLELNEEMVAQEYNDCKKEEYTTPVPAVPESSTPLPAAPVAMIDFPCQPGYLPDSRGRCREVW